MEETAPFVSLKPEDDLWDDSEPYELRTSFQPGLKEPRWRRICSTKRITVACFVAIAIGVIIAFVLVVRRTKPGHGATTKLCLTAHCIESSSEVMSFMNFSADPCDNFFDYACGGWEKKNDIPDTESDWGQFSILNLQNDNFLKKLINDPEIKTKYKNNTAVTKAFAYYESCFNRTRINELGAKPMHDLIAKYGSWNLTGSWNSSSWNFMNIMVRMQMELAVFPFFTMYTGPDYFNSTLNIIKLDQAGLELTRETYLVDNSTDYEKLRKAYKKFMIQTVGLLGAKGKNVEKQMMDVYNLEYEIAKITIPVSERRNIEKHYKKMSIRQLVNDTGNIIDWKDFLAQIYKPQQYPISDDTIVVVFALDYLKNVSQLYNNTSKTTVVNYMMWSVIRKFINYLSDDFKKVFQQYNEASSGTTEEESNWRQCLAATAIPFGSPLGLMFIKEKFTPKSKTMVEELIREIRKIFIQNLDQVVWMDKKTKRVAKEKASGILENIGYPKYLTNKTELQERFSGFDPTNNYFNNGVKKSGFMIKKNYGQIKKPVNSKEWDMDPQMVNAYYSFSKNKIVFPAGILQAPFYNKDRPRSLNYGGIGAVVGHEITHGFDDNGRRFNKDGNLVKWWTNHSIEAFTNKTKCLIKQYSKYKFFGEQIKGAQTLGENIADNGGVKQAYQAYQRFVAENGEERLLPGINATNNQLFFLGFAQVWCGKSRKQLAINQVANGVHTPGKYRVIGTLSNSVEFAKAFNCKPKSQMNPEEKCQVW